MGQENVLNKQFSLNVLQEIEIVCIKMKYGKTIELKWFVLHRTTKSDILILFKN